MTPNSASPPLDQLKGLHFPEAVSQWPIAMGWILLALCTLAAAIFISRYIYNTLKKNRYRRQSLNRLSVIFTDYQQHTNDRELLVQVNGLLKAVAIKRYSPVQCAGLSGTQWVSFLEQSSAKSKAIDTDVFTHFASIYTPQVALNAQQRQQLASAASLWLKKHHDIDSKEQARV